MKVAVIIVHYGDIELTKKCIDSLYKNEEMPFSLIVVNNAANNYTWKDFSKQQLTVINSTRNLGFAKGVNKGIVKALQMDADYVCLLNNDTTIHKSFLQQLLASFTNSHIGIVGPAIQFKKDGKTLYDIGGKINPLILRTSHEEVSNITSLTEKTVTYVSGCCMMIKKEVFKKIGFFDEHFFLYYEDVDFCLRAKKNGFTTMVISSAVINHALSASAGKMSKTAIYHVTKSSIYFGKKYATSPIKKVFNKLFILIQALLFFKANPKAGLVITKALLD